MPTNLLTNPSFELAVFPWKARGNSTIQRVPSSLALDGRFVGRITALAAAVDTDIDDDAGRAAVVAGQSFVYSIRIRPLTIAREVAIFVEWIGTPGAAGSSGVICQPGVWTTVSMTGTAPAGTTALRPAIRIKNVAAAGEQFLIDALAVYVGQTDPAYSDPATPTLNTADAGVDQTVPAGSSVTLIGKPPEGRWAQDSGDVVTIPAQVTTATDTRITVTASNASTVAALARSFRYTYFTPAADDFERADTAASLGTTPTGGYPWTPSPNRDSGEAGTPAWGISAGRAYCTHGSGVAANTIDTGRVNHDVSMRLLARPAANNYASIVLSYIDEGNYVFVQVAAGGEVSLQRRTANTDVTLFQHPSIFAVAGDILRCRRINGNQYEMLLNDVQLHLTGTGETAFPTATKAGLRSGRFGASVIYFDDFVAA